MFVVVSLCQMFFDHSVEEWHHVAKIWLWNLAQLVYTLYWLGTCFCPWSHINLKGKWILAQEAVPKICSDIAPASVCLKETQFFESHEEVFFFFSSLLSWEIW